MTVQHCPVCATVLLGADGELRCPLLSCAGEAAPATATPASACRCDRPNVAGDQCHKCGRPLA